jgi:hypothetical protein
MREDATQWTEMVVRELTPIERVTLPGDGKLVEVPDDQKPMHHGDVIRWAGIQNTNGVPLQVAIDGFPVDRLDAKNKTSMLNKSARDQQITAIYERYCDQHGQTLAVVKLKFDGHNSQFAWDAVRLEFVEVDVADDYGLPRIVNKAYIRQAAKDKWNGMHPKHREPLASYMMDVDLGLNATPRQMPVIENCYSDWFNNNEWDKTKRLDKLLECIPFNSEEEKKQFRELMKAQVAQTVYNRVAKRVGVLVGTSDDGKSNLFYTLFGKPFGDAAFCRIPPSDQEDDRRMKFLARSWAAFFDDMQKNKVNYELVKDIVGQTSTLLRSFNTQEYVVVKRCYAFWGASDRVDFLPADSDEHKRYLPITLKEGKINYAEYNKLDIKQIWLEVRTLVDAEGIDDKVITPVSTVINEHRQTVMESELVDMFVHAGGELMNTTEIMMKLNVLADKTPVKNINTLGSALRRKFGAKEGSNGKKGWRVNVGDPPPETKDKKKESKKDKILKENKEVKLKKYSRTKETFTGDQTK